MLASRLSAASALKGKWWNTNFLSCEWCLSPDATRITPKCLEPLSLCAAWTTRHAQIIIIRLSMWNVSYVVAIVRIVRSMAVWVVASFFRFPISAAVRWILLWTNQYVRCMHALFLPITTMRYMSWLGGNVFLRTETATSHVFAQMHDEKWHMQRHTARKTRSPWRCQQMNHFFFFFFLVKGQTMSTNGENKMKWRKAGDVCNECN